MLTSTIFTFFINFLFYYPFAMSILWTLGALFFYFRREHNKSREAPIFDQYPFVSVLIPTHNEEISISSTILSILSSNYPNFEVIVVDDGSIDKTPAILEEMVDRYPKLRFLRLQENKGKPTALRYGTLASRGDIILTIDADAHLDADAIHWMVGHFLSGPRVGAVTGNPRVRNRTTLLAKIQVGEYSSIIGMIKRTQRILGKVLTVSGVIVAFRKQALLDVDLWDIDMITDDINITWKLEKRFWDIRYEPNALCWILVPESLSGLWKQRVRWAQGGGEVIRRHINIWKDWRQRRMWPVYLEYVTSVMWSYTYVTFLSLWILSFLFPFMNLHAMSLLPGWKGSLLVLISVIQFSVALYIDKRYEKGLFKYVFWVIWYPWVYWILTAFATVKATPTALFRKMGAPATWVSPDRGLS
ncbi:poly-beta-1,6-N-acetyl-D-glucosamine synthase [Pelosinus sp. IPA-1]|uniref:poly-beta-1,6-N-acetyl-D-glucosamine synthase n=1 Tax=Pelosinus sp. IPA-1 TaxID=3029569 RepID=UPI00243626E3|nr:poly-beta-1,6-N-acetyl-D-glucosamine synthase [Pelosinus sp. IPA-1]GMB00752.1 poly-beta-1,6 N-acetyl-D-glucosamine synthase [Pelosinus sp. IPA-1]